MTDQSQQDFNQEPIIMREKKESSSTLWYIVITILVLALLGWLGYTAGWFSPRNTTDTVDIPPISNDNGGFGTILENAAPIDSVTIETTETFPVEQTVVVSGMLPNGCTYLNTPSQLRDGNVFYISLDTRTEGDVCTEALVPYEERIGLPVNNLPAGVYIVNINGREISFELENNNTLDFSAGEDK